MKLLKQILRYKRPHGSGSECAFIHRFLDCLPGIYSDVVGNRILRIGESPILWSCHTDTVHKTEGLQKVFYKKNVLRSNSNCLGADDGAGMWLMLKMIKKKVPGLYIFHRGEEVGGIGSHHISTHSKKLLKDIKYAIALDRKGYTDVITHQGARCCSDDFAKSLAKELDMGYKPSDRGLFTDTANYTDEIGECTNLSIGYFSQHCMLESQDGKFLMKLLEALIKINPDNLVENRVPGEYEAKVFQSYTNYGGYHNDNFFSRKGAKKSTYQESPSYNDTEGWNLYYDNDVEDDETTQLAKMMDLYPQAVARLLIDNGITPEDIRQEALFAY